MTKFPEAKYYDDKKHLKKIKPYELDDDLYEEKYKKRKGKNKKKKSILLCPFENCYASLSFTERKNGKKYFSTIKKGTHLNRCPYGVDYEGEVERSEVNNKKTESVLTKDHKKKVIDNTIDIIEKKDEDVDIASEEEDVKTKKIVEGKEATNEEAVLVDNNDDKTKQRNIRIYKRKASEVTEKDCCSNPRCVYGKISGAYYNDEEEYGYIFFKNNDLAACFSESFIKNNPGANNSLSHLIEIINNSEKEDLELIAIGEIKKGKNRFNVKIEDLVSIRINRYPYYEILKNPDLIL